MSPRLPLPFALLLALALLAGCDSTAPKRPGELVTATLVSPNGAEGAAVLEFTGPGVREVTSEAARVFARTSGDVTRVVVVRDQPGTIQLRVRLADPTRKPAAAVVEVAGGDDAVRPSLAGSRVDF